MKEKITKIIRKADWLDRETQLHQLKKHLNQQTILAITKHAIYLTDHPTKVQKHLMHLMLISRLGTFLKVLGTTLISMLGVLVILGSITSDTGDCTIGMLKIIDVTIPIWITSFVLIAIGLLLEQGFKSYFDKWIKQNRIKVTENEK